MSECTHTPKCRFNCIICGKLIPEWVKIEPGGNDFIVHFEKGIQNHVPQVHSEKDAINVAQISIARAAALCMDHIVRVIRVEKIDSKAVSDHPEGDLKCK